MKLFRKFYLCLRFFTFQIFINESELKHIRTLKVGQISSSNVLQLFSSGLWLEHGETENKILRVNSLDSLLETKIREVI